MDLKEMKVKAGMAVLSLGVIDPLYQQTFTIRKALGVCEGWYMEVAEVTPVNLRSKVIS